MSDGKKHPNRIPFEEIESIRSWHLPSLGSAAKVVPTAQREASKRQQQQDVIIEDVAASQVKPLTASELQQMAEQAEKEGRDHGYKEGYAQGLEDGRQKGLQTGESKAYAEHGAQLREQIASLHQIADALMFPLETQNQALESLLVDMAIQIARHLIGQAVTADPQIIFRMVERAMDSLPVGTENIQISLHPDDVLLLQNHLPAEAAHWHLQADSRLQRGGCRVASQRSLVDYSIAHRIEQFLEQVKEEGEEATPVMTADYRPPQRVETPAAILPQGELETGFPQPTDATVAEMPAAATDSVSEPLSRSDSGSPEDATQRETPE